MAGFDVESSALQAAGSQLASTGEEIRAAFAPVRGQVDNLVDGGWSGGAATSFATAWDEWQIGYRAAMEALDRMSGLLIRSGQRYDSAEQSSHANIAASGTGL